MGGFTLHPISTKKITLTLPSEEGQTVTVPLMIQILQLLPRRRTQTLGQAVQVRRAELHGLVTDVDHVLGTGLPLGANVTEARERGDGDDVRVRDTGDVAGKPTITTSLRGGEE